MRIAQEPGYTQQPNIMYDEWMRELTGTEFKVLSFICRKTFGWGKDRDIISLSQMEEFTGCSRTAIKESIKSLEYYGIIECKRGTKTPTAFIIKTKKSNDDDENITYSERGGGQKVTQNKKSGSKSDLDKAKSGSKSDPTKEINIKKMETKEKDTQKDFHDEKTVVSPHDANTYTSTKPTSIKDGGKSESLHSIIMTAFHKGLEKLTGDNTYQNYGKEGTAIKKIVATCLRLAGGDEDQAKAIALGMMAHYYEQCKKGGFFGNAGFSPSVMISTWTGLYTQYMKYNRTKIEADRLFDEIPALKTLFKKKN